MKAFQVIYNKIGLEKGLETILNDFYQRLSKDVMVGFFFDGKNLPQIAQKQKEFIMRAMGITKVYSGKPPAAAHVQLPPILSGHFDRRLRILEETLHDHGLSESEISTWVAFENMFRNSIVK